MYKNNKGITLIALVVSIIVLIILAGVSINLLVGNNGIIGNAKYAKNITEKEQLNEQKELNEIVEYMNYTERMEDFAKNITFNYSSKNWTNKNVTVTASTTLTNYKIQTSTDANTWGDETSQTLSENGNVYARLVNTTVNSETEYVVATVDKIDKVKPVITSVATTTNTITIKATDEASGIIGYTVTESTTEPTSFTSCTSTKSLNVTVKNKTQGKTYYVWVKDSAGNVSAYKQVKTGTVTKSEGNITFTYSTTNWTNQDVTVTASTTITGYKLQTSTDAKTWKDETSQTLSANGNVYARLVDSTNQATGYATATVDKIDKVNPTITSVSNSSGGNWKNESVTITINSSDADSKVARAVYSYDKKTEYKDTVGTTTATATISTEINSEVFVRVYDNAGNASDWTSAGFVKISKTGPSVPTITYNGGSNSHSWQEDYEITLLSTATSGIVRYEVDKDKNETVDQTIDASGKFIPEDGYNSCTVRFRAVDNAGNVSQWTEENHIHMDTSHPATNGGTESVHTKCSRCGKTLSTKHEYIKTEVVTNATCTTKGTSRYTCSCGYIYDSQDIPALGHIWRINGYTEVTESNWNETGVHNSQDYAQKITAKSTKTINVYSSATEYTTKTINWDNTVAFQCYKDCTLHFNSDTYVYNECTRYPKLTYKCFVCGATSTSGQISSLEPDANMIGPFNAEITISGNYTQTSLPVNLSVKVTHKANENPIQIESCKYAIIRDSLPLGMNEDKYTGGTFSSNGQTINISLDTEGDWYIHVLSVDSTGAKRETIKGPIKVN